MGLKKNMAGYMGIALAASMAGESLSDVDRAAINEGVDYRPSRSSIPKSPLTNKQKKVRVKNKLAKQSRKVNYKKNRLS